MIPLPATPDNGCKYMRHATSVVLVMHGQWGCWRNHFLSLLGLWKIDLYHTLVHTLSQLSYADCGWRHALSFHTLSYKFIGKPSRKDTINQHLNYLEVCRGKWRNLCKLYWYLFYQLHGDPLQSPQLKGGDTDEVYYSSCLTTIKW